MPYGVYLVHHGRAAEALPTFAWAVAQSPGASSNAAAYYWLALAAWKGGDAAGAASQATRLRLALGPHTGQVSERQLEGKARLLQAGLDPAGVQAQAVDFDAGTL